MFSKTLVTCALLLLQALRGNASPVLASDDDELVRIPFGGLVPKSTVHQVPEGGRVIHTPTEVTLLDANGKTLHTAPLTNSKPLFNHANNPNTPPTIAPRTIQGVAEAVVQVPNLFSFLSTWEVPPSPQVQSGQLLMYFSALGPPSGDALFLVSLQYGVSAAGGGNFWAIVTWLITSEQTFVTNLTTVDPNASIEAAVINQDQFFGTATMHAWFASWNLFAASQFNIMTTETFNVAFIALETSGVFLSGNLPNEPTGISDIFIEIDKGSNEVVPIPWTFFNDTNDGINIISTTLSVTPENGQMAIEYPKF